MSTFPSHRVYILHDSLLYIYTAKKRPLKLCGFQWALGNSMHRIRVHLSSL